jgi:hypothetical protein
MKIEQSYTYIVHQYFYVETQCGRKPQNDFSYMSLRITFIGSTNSFCSIATTGRRLQPPIFSSYNLREAPTPPILWLQTEGGYNPLRSPATIRRWLQPHILASSNHISLPPPTALKYKCQITNETIVTLSL